MTDGYLLSLFADVRVDGAVDPAITEENPLRSVLERIAAAKGTKVKFIATGTDSPQMLAELEQLFAKKFDES